MKGAIYRVLKPKFISVSRQKSLTDVLNVVDKHLNLINYFTNRHVTYEEQMSIYYFYDEVFIQFQLQNRTATKGTR